MPINLLTNCGGTTLLTNCASNTLLCSCPDCCLCGPGITLPIKTYITGGYTGTGHGYRLSNGGPVAVPPWSSGCTPVYQTGKDITATVAGLGFSQTFNAPDFVWAYNEDYSSIEVQCVDDCGMLVYAGHAQLDFRAKPGIPRVRQPNGPGATLTVTYNDCVAWLAAHQAGAVFPNPDPPWCGNPMGCECEKMTIVYTWAGGWDLFTETTFLGNSLGWIYYGTTAPYMSWQDFSPAGGMPSPRSGHEDYTINVEEAYAAGAWATSTTINLEANWYAWPAGTPVTVTVTYNNVTQTHSVTSPGAIPVVTAFVYGPTSQVVTPIGNIVVNADKTFTLTVY